MNKVTVVRNENFTTVSNIPLQNKDLSWKAKGLLVYLMTLPPSWEIRLSDLENRSIDGRDSTNGAIRELMKHGYITRIPVTEKGKFMGYDYTVTDSPKETGTGFPQRLDRNGSPATENPSLVITKEEIPKKGEYPQDSQPIILATLLLTEHRKHDDRFLLGKDAPTLQRWASDIDKLMRLDKRTPEEVRRVILWCQSPGCFWIPNILSGAKLREKFPQLLLGSMNGKPALKISGTSHDPTKPAYQEVLM